MPQEILFLCLLAIVAFLYASVGHGGASGYLALMALFSISPIVAKPTALLLNVAVASIAFIQFYRAGHFKLSLFWPFALTSIPAAYFGSMIPISDQNYKRILGFCLLIAILRMLIQPNKRANFSKYIIPIGLISGAIIGLLSGMIGIGGGIILSPLLLILGLATLKETAAVSALFILVNSISALFGLFQKGFLPTKQHFVWLFVALIFGTIGSFLGSKKFNFNTLKYLLALGLLVASFKLILV
jgi:uncharacterized protein